MKKFKQKCLYYMNKKKCNIMANEATFPQNKKDLKFGVGISQSPYHFQQRADQLKSRSHVKNALHTI